MAEAIILKLIFILLLALMTLLQGCSNHREVVAEQPAFVDQTPVCQSKIGDDGEVAGKIFSLVKKLDGLIEAYHKRYQYPSLREAGILYPRNVNLTPQQPLRIGRMALAKMLDELMAKIESFKDFDLRPWLNDGIVPDFTAGQTLSNNVLYKLRVMVAQIYGLETMALRYQNASCNAEELARNIHKDLASYLVLKGLECSDEGQRPDGVPYCLQEILAAWNDPKYSEVRDQALPHLISLCGIVRDKFAMTCEEEVDSAIRSGTLLPWYKDHAEQIRMNRFKPLFEMRSESKRYACASIRDGKTTVMTIPYVSSGETIDKILEEIGQSYWRHNNSFYIKFVPVESPDRIPSNALRILVRSGVLSHVREDRPNELILATPTLQNKTMLKLTIAHELGHILGFADCYVEYFNQVSQELVYYEVDSSNLMCSIQLGNYIPALYFTKLIHDRCQF